MTTAAATTPHTHTGGTMSPTQFQMVAFAREVLNNRSMRFSENKISRLVRDFRNRNTHTTGYAFFIYLCNRGELSEHQTREALMDPEIARYFRRWDDPTGEDAVAHVLRERGY